MVGSINTARLRNLLDIEDRFEILLVLALGVPSEKVVIDLMPADGNYDYWRDESDVHHVPKRSLEEVIVKEYTSVKEG